MLNNLIYGANLYRVTYSSQEIDIGLANGDTIAANGAARYQGLNYFLDADPAPNLHVFMNGNVEARALHRAMLSADLRTTDRPSPTSPPPLLTSGPRITSSWGTEFRSFLSALSSSSERRSIFDNSLGAPSDQTMPSYGTVNLGVTAPFKHFDLLLNGLNILNRKYNEYLYISSGGYFGTATNGYELAYPAAPFTVYGGVRFHF